MLPRQKWIGLPSLLSSKPISVNSSMSQAFAFSQDFARPLWLRLSAFFVKAIATEVGNRTRL